LSGPRDDEEPKLRTAAENGEQGQPSRSGSTADNDDVEGTEAFVECMLREQDARLKVVVDQIIAERGAKHLAELQWVERAWQGKLEA
jgi:hypothetical protein